MKFQFGGIMKLVKCALAVLRNFGNPSLRLRYAGITGFSFYIFEISKTSGWLLSKS